MEGDIIKEDLLYVFKRLLEKNKITVEEYHKAVNIILHQYHSGTVKDRGMVLYD